MRPEHSYLWRTAATWTDFHAGAQRIFTKLQENVLGSQSPLLRRCEDRDRGQNGWYHGVELKDSDSVVDVSCPWKSHQKMIFTAVGLSTTKFQSHRVRWNRVRGLWKWIVPLRQLLRSQFCKLLLKGLGQKEPLWCGNDAVLECFKVRFARNV